MTSVVRVASLGLLIAAAMVVPVAVVAADAPPDPDAACAQEATFKSIDGTTTASLKVINNTDTTVQTFWLDYSGHRVFYRQVGPHTSYVQATWLTHPWIVASLTGICYRLAVMTSLEQTVTVDPGSTGVVVPPAPTLPPADTFPAPIETFPPLASASPLVIGSTGNPTDNGQGFPILPVAIGALVVVAGLVGGLSIFARRDPDEDVDTSNGLFGGQFFRGDTEQLKADIDQAGAAVGQIVGSGAAVGTSLGSDRTAGVPSSGSSPPAPGGKPAPQGSIGGSIGHQLGQELEDMKKAGAEIGKAVGEQAPKPPDPR